ncbi:hypothetical protein IT396_00205 [Candidatus Nomurabacteria bacterium]|nr:hypothetical protein [Candidatus Nomurabacteria bacterium]
MFSGLEQISETKLLGFILFAGALLIPGALILQLTNSAIVHYESIPFVIYCIAFSSPLAFTGFLVALYTQRELHNGRWFIFTGVFTLIPFFLSLLLLQIGIFTYEVPNFYIAFMLGLVLFFVLEYFSFLIPHRRRDSVE